MRDWAPSDARRTPRNRFHYPRENALLPREVFIVSVRGRSPRGDRVQREWRQGIERQHAEGRRLDAAGRHTGDEGDRGHRSRRRRAAEVQGADRHRAGAEQHRLHASIPQPKEDGYILGMSTDLRFADGTVPPVDVIHLHHGVWLNLAGRDTTVPSLPERFFAAGEEKTRMLAHTGYGYKFDTSKDKWLLNYMLHNQLSKPDKVWVTYDLDFVPMTSPLAKTIKPAKPVWMDVQNGSIYPVFDVLQGSGKNGTYTYPDDAGDPYACRRATG